ncbi:MULTISPECIES: hypothetical protein [unclassified Paenibacillus]|uniref:hypothetical protein n=1 Tax=Paenibacillus TaxID=44249 RepID=UPI0007BF094C|nr:MULTISPECIES: hypothetical protein [unclassified Paenibacillus]SEB06310.1 hypothetical protein SAMN03159332_3216 [Paenibacillus sp. 276b]SHN74687.1 hypothetical protein SAMN04487896_3524 [Paenibacillus sp. ov031]
MKRKFLFIPVVSLILLLIGCSSSSGSFASDKMIKLKEEVYITSNDIISEEELAEQVGEIEVSSTNESDHGDGNVISSNTYNVGTKLFKIKNENSKDMIAVEDSTEKYLIAYNTKYKEIK